MLRPVKAAEKVFYDSESIPYRIVLIKSFSVICIKSITEKEPSLVTHFPPGILRLVLIPD